MPAYWEDPTTPTAEETQWSPMIAAAANTLEPAQNASTRKPSSLASLRAAVNRRRKEQEQEAKDLCRYPSKQCLQKRAMKRNGEMHSFCEFHRGKANRNQRKLERKRRAKKAIEKIEEDKLRMTNMVSQARYCGNSFGDLEWNGFEWVPRQFTVMHAPALPAFHHDATFNDTLMHHQQVQHQHQHQHHPTVHFPTVGFSHPMDHSAFVPFDPTNGHLPSTSAPTAVASAAVTLAMVEFPTTTTAAVATTLSEIDSLSMLPEDFTSLVPPPAFDAIHRSLPAVNGSIVHWSP